MDKKQIYVEKRYPSEEIQLNWSLKEPVVSIVLIKIKTTVIVNHKQEALLSESNSTALKDAPSLDNKSLTLAQKGQYVLLRIQLTIISDQTNTNNTSSHLTKYRNREVITWRPQLDCQKRFP